MTDWTTTPLTTLAIATTGFDPATAELCGYALLTTTSDGTFHQRHHSPIRTQNPIPADSTAVHGITDADARWAMSPLDAAGHLHSTLTSLDTPLVGFHAPWIMAVINAHLARYGHEPVTVTTPLIDPLVLDKVNQARAASGNRTLPAIRDRWNLAPMNYGSAPNNAVAAAELTHTMVQAIPRFRGETPAALSAHCAHWYVETEEDYRGFLRSVGKEPQGEMHPWPAQTPVDA